MDQLVVNEDLGVLNEFQEENKAWILQAPVFVLSCSVMSDSLRPHGLQPTRLLCP